MFAGLEGLQKVLGFSVQGVGLRAWGGLGSCNQIP